MEPFLLHQGEQGLSISAPVCNRRRRAHNLIGALIEGYSAQYGPSDVSVRDNTQQNSLFVDYEGNLELGHIDSSDNLADRCVRRCEIGRASRRERVELSVVSVALWKKECS